MQNPLLFSSPAHPFSFTQAAQKTFPAAHFPSNGPFPRPWPNPAQRHTLPPCLTARRAPPVGSVSLPRPSRTQAQSPTRSRTRRRAPPWPARQGSTPLFKRRPTPWAPSEPQPPPSSPRQTLAREPPLPSSGATHHAAVCRFPDELDHRRSFAPK